MNFIISFVAAVLLVIGLAGNGFEMRKIRLSTVKEEEMITKNVFLDKGNFKWYACIGAALLLMVISSLYT